MNSFRATLKQKKDGLANPNGWFRNEDGAIDLASIMVGIIVIGLIGGVIAATVFAVIPWTQDNAAKQQLDSVVAAESAYMGLTSDPSAPLPTGGARNTYGNSNLLTSAGLLGAGKTYCASTSTDGKAYSAFAQSSSGKVFTVTSQNSKPVIHTGTLPADCQFITGEYVDPYPMRTTLTYRCDTDVATGALPIHQTVNGTETWSDGVTKTVTAAPMPTRSFTAGVTYTVNFDGTYSHMASNASVASMNLRGCLRSVDHWGSNTGVTSASYAFSHSPNLVSVPSRIPSTITILMGTFSNSAINDPNISQWNVSNVWRISEMFEQSPNFNQPLNNWNVSKVTSFDRVFNGATSFNQPLDKWNTSLGDDFSSMFSNATSFNQPLNSWNTSRAKYMTGMFSNATSFNQPLDNWNMSRVWYMNIMFYGATSFNQPLNSWNVSNALSFERMFQGATNFNQPLNNWNVAKVTTMNNMFNTTGHAFNQDLSGWNTAALTSGNDFAPNTFNSLYLPPKTTKAA